MNKIHDYLENLNISFSSYHPLWISRKLYWSKERFSDYGTSSLSRVPELHLNERTDFTRVSIVFFESPQRERNSDLFFFEFHMIDDLRAGETTR